MGAEAPAVQRLAGRGQAEEEGLAPGSWSHRAPTGEKAGQVRGQTLGWGGGHWGGGRRRGLWGAGSHSQWCLSLLSLSLLPLALSPFFLNLDLAFLSALMPLPQGA